MPIPPAGIKGGNMELISKIDIYLINKAYNRNVTGNNKD